MIENTVYAILSTTTINNIFPSEPADNTTYPFIVYTESGATQNQYMSGSSDLINYTYQIDVWTKTEDENVTLANEVRTTMTAFKDEHVLTCNFEGSSSDKQERGYHSTSNYSIWHHI